MECSRKLRKFEDGPYMNDRGRGRLEFRALVFGAKGRLLDTGSASALL